VTTYRDLPTSPVPDRIVRLWMPERKATLGESLRETEREFEETSSSQNLLDLTYADTHRFPPADWVIEEFSAAATGGSMTYTPYRGDPSVRERVAESVSDFLGFPVDPERELILTPGTQAALFASLASYVDVGHRVLLPDPEYLSSERMLRFFGAEVEHVPIVWDEDSSPTLAFEAFEAALKRMSRLLLFSHPNNPSGAVYDEASLARIATLARENDVSVVVDELYSRLVYDGKPYLHLAALEGMRERTVTLLGPSKTESMSGYRVGVAVGPAQTIDRMEDVLGVAALRAPAYAQHTLKRWMVDDVEMVAKRISEYQALRDVTVERLSRSEALDVRVPAGTAYAFPKVLNRDASDQEIAKRLKLEAGVVVNPGYQFGPQCDGHFRVCFAQDEEVWSRTLDRIVEVLEALPQHA